MYLLCVPPSSSWHTQNFTDRCWIFSGHSGILVNWGSIPDYSLMSDADEFIKTEHTSGDDKGGGSLLEVSDTQGLRIITHDAWVTETVCWIKVSACVPFQTK